MDKFQAPAIDFRIPDGVDEETREVIEKVAGLACHLAGALAQDWSDPEASAERLTNAVEEIDRVAGELRGEA